MNILFLSRWFPFPFNNGSKLRIYNLLRGLSRQHKITLLSFVDQADLSIKAPEIRSICSNVYVVPWTEFDPHSLRARLGFLSLTPRSLIDTFSPEMARKIGQLLAQQDFDLVIASQLQMAAYAPYIGNRPALFEEVELGLSYDDTGQSVPWQRRVSRALTWFKFRRYLTPLLKSFRAITVTSVREKELVLRHFELVNDILVIPNCIDMQDYQDIKVQPKPGTLIFTGSFRYRTNYEAMVWFLERVFPLVLETMPETQLIITGDHAGLQLPTLRNMTLAGYVDDIKSLIASSTIALAPLWSGGGTRLKILEAMAIGTPVVATTKGAEGLDAEPGRHLFIADEPSVFAACVVRLLADGALRQNLVANAKELVRAKYDWGNVLPEFLHLVSRISQE